MVYGISTLYVLFKPESFFHQLYDFKYSAVPVIMYKHIQVDHSSDRDW